MCIEAQSYTILILKTKRMLKSDPAANPVSFMNILLRMVYIYRQENTELCLQFAFCKITQMRYFIAADNQVDTCRFLKKKQPKT